MVRRLFVVLPLLLLAAFCFFGFLATYEPPVSPRLGATYVGGIAACLVAATWELCRKGDR